MLSFNYDIRIEAWIKGDIASYHALQRIFTFSYYQIIKSSKHQTIKSSNDQTDFPHQWTHLFQWAAQWQQ